MTSPIMPEHACRIIETIALRRGFMLDELLEKNTDPEVTAGRYNAFSALARFYPTPTIAKWFGINRNNVLVGLKAFRALIGAPPIVAPRSPPKPKPTSGVAPVTPRAKLRPMSEIADEVAASYGVTALDLSGPSCCRAMSVPRQAAMFEMFEAGHTTIAIGAHLARDPSTVSHGVAAHRARIAAEWSGREAA
jgi:hypothetical protein